VLVGLAKGGRGAGSSRRSFSGGRTGGVGKYICHSRPRLREDKLRRESSKTELQK